MRFKLLFAAVAALFLMGCVTQTELCVGGNCTNASLNVSVEVPEVNFTIPTPSPIAFEPVILFELLSGESTARLGDEVDFTVDFELPEGEGNLSYAEIKVYAGEDPVGEHSAVKGEPLHLSYSIPALRVGDSVYSSEAKVYYANGSEYDSIERSFLVQVTPISYYRNEFENRSVNSSSKAAQSFTIERALEITRVSFYGMKKADAAIQFELCVDDDGVPGQPLYYNNYDVAGVPELPAWYSVGLNASLEPGKYWILLTTMGEFEWHCDLYGEDESSDSVYRYGGEWLSDSRDKFYRVTNE